MITVTAFRWVPDFARGQVRDLRVRWALEEAGLAYRTRLIGPADQADADYRRQQPFGQVPVLEQDGLTLFESGAIVLHIGSQSDLLLPPEPHARARAAVWVLAALNTIEPPVMELAGIDLFHAGEDWAQVRRPAVEDDVRRRLAELARWLGDRAWLEERFTAGDLMMAAVLRIVAHTDLLTEQPALAAYRARCEARPAFQRALQAQLADLADAPDKAAG